MADASYSNEFHMGVRSNTAMNTDTEKVRIIAAKKIHERARDLRGRFLNLVAVIERDVALILVDYFCTEDQDKRKLFFTQVVNAHSLSLNAKKDILVKIVKNDYPSYWDKNSDILKTLDEILQFRNKLAHSVVDVSEEALARPIDKGIGFIEWKEGEPVTDADAEEWEVKANMVLSCLSDIKRLLRFKEKKCLTTNSSRSATPAAEFRR